MPLFSKRIDHTNAADQWEQSEPTAVKRRIYTG